jgi:Cd2+/Zn2+-exporting ATPase
LALLALIEGRSSHPVAACLVQAAKNENALIPRDLIMTEHTLLKGEGVSANISGTTIYVGNQRLFARLDLLDSLPENQKEKTDSWASTGSMIGFIGTKEDGIVGAFCVKDTIRKESKSVVQDLRDKGIEIMLCTGDSNAVAKAVANEIGIAPDCVRSQMLPEEKYKYVENLKRKPKRGCAVWQNQQYVLFCGDGINDAPALATADIGCALGEGAAMAMVTSDITLMDSNLSKITETISIGKKVRKTIKENIILSLLGKLVVVALTFSGEMSLLLAVASDVGIMLLVTLNGMKVLSSTQDDPKLGMGKVQPYKDSIEMQSLFGNNDAVGEIV